MLFSSYHTMLFIYAYTYGKSFLLFHFVMDQYQVRCLGAFAVVLDGCEAVITIPNSPPKA